MGGVVWGPLVLVTINGKDSDQNTSCRNIVMIEDLLTKRHLLGDHIRKLQKLLETIEIAKLIEAIEPGNHPGIV